MVRVCFVCLGNICRSPTAEGIFKKLVEEAKLTDKLDVDSAGTSGFHVGEQADRRSAQEARRRGMELTSRSRQFVSGDFQRFGYVLAMDASNLANLSALNGAGSYTGVLTTLRSFDPTSAPSAAVPDPYYGGPDGFSDVFDLCERACVGLLAQIRIDHGW
jgi:protein-tyrosine phosphatase